jgi:molecular chaperone GrpE
MPDAGDEPVEGPPSGADGNGPTDGEHELLDVGPVDADVLADLPGGVPEGDLTVEQIVAERDDYLDALLRVKAEFENHRKRTARERETLGSQATAQLAGELLVVLDACEAAIAQGAADVEPVAKSLAEVLMRGGLEVMPPDGVAFDPHQHEAVLHEPAEPDGDDGGPTVVETLRTGYLWQGQVLRPAMVRVRG